MFIPLLPNMHGDIIITTMIIVNVSSGGGRHVVVWARQIGGGATQLPLTLSIWDPGTLPLNPTLTIWPSCLYAQVREGVTQKKLLFFWILSKSGGGEGPAQVS